MRRLAPYFFVILTVAAIAYLAGCGASGNNSAPVITAARPTYGPGTNVNVLPPTIQLAFFQTVNFQASGGIPPYEFLVIAGQGQITFTTGHFTAGGSNSTVTVLVTDSSGLSTQATVTVGTGTGTGTVGGTTPTDCSSMLSDNEMAIEDTTATGLGDVMDEENTNSPGECDLWCSSLGAGYCEWTTGNGSPICLAWPVGTPMQPPYQVLTGVTVYAGACQ
jgi:hypothetical protein